MGEVVNLGEATLPPDFSNGVIEPSKPAGGLPDCANYEQQLAASENASWARHCRKQADEYKAMVLRSLPDSVSLRLILSLYVQAERDHAKAEQQ